MATYYIYRKNIPGTLSPLMLKHYAQAFRTLYCNDLTGDLSKPKLEIIVKGEWPNYDADGLFLTNRGAKVISIGRNLVTVELLDFKDEKPCKIELTPRYEPGFSEIMFITVSGE